MPVGRQGSRNTRKHAITEPAVDPRGLLLDALNHIRFLVYLEWRVIHELLANARR